MKLETLLNALAIYDLEIGGVAAFIQNATGEQLDIEVSSISNDSSKISLGSIFVAIAGHKVDGHDFIDSARNSGAVFIVGTNPDADIDLLVNNSRALLGPAASCFASYPSEDMSILGVTGTNGKTTITYILSAILKAAKLKHAVIGTTGIFIDGVKKEVSQTTPDAIILQNVFKELKNDDINNVAMEVSSHALDQMRVLGTRFASVGFSNLSQDHLDYHENFEKYFEAKARLFDGKYAHCGVINIDCETWSQKLVETMLRNGMEVILSSTKDPSADLFLNTISSTLSESIIEINFVDSQGTVFERKISSKLIGDFNVENIAVAFGMAIQSGIDPDIIAQALSSDIIVPGRLQRVLSDKPYEVFVDYAHTPDALKRAIEVLKPLSKKVIVVFGCGGDRDREKRPIMGTIASSLADSVILTNDNPRNENPSSIIDEIYSGIADAYQSNSISITDRFGAIEYALSIAGEGDSVLIAGKGHETYQEFSDRVEDFSDVESVEEILRNSK